MRLLRETKMLMKLNILTLAIGIPIAFLAIYLAAASLIGAINQADVNNLSAMFSGLGIISKVFKFPLVIVKKILNVCRD
jgi:hypothetical protein